MKTEYNKAIDIFKWLAALMIIAIHTAFLSDVSEWLYFGVVHVVARMAVPFFAMSTGYLIAGQMKRESGNLDKEYTALIKKHWMKLINVYLMCTAIYLVYSVPKWIKTGWFSVWAFVDYFIATVRQGSYYHLWYLLAVIYAFPFFIIVLKKVTAKYYLIIAGGIR